MFQKRLFLFERVSKTLLKALGDKENREEREHREPSPVFLEKRKKYSCPSIQNGSNLIRSAFEFIFDFILDLITGTNFCPGSIPLNIMLSNLDRSIFGLSRRSELLISNEAIQFYDYEILLYTIPRESLHMNHFVKHESL